ncbi:hypothetical protein N7455_007500 [Penicillium solitum]|uniref:uncharacterized protein n=1 Tax=Penicillium solitum TaxID=60172 RepID=UPI0032C3F7AB|nr:hypothetical protein N7455_007500 [Penicillium solitum]
MPSDPVSVSLGSAGHKRAATTHLASSLSPSVPGSSPRVSERCRPSMGPWLEIRTTLPHQADRPLGRDGVEDEGYMTC